VAAIGHDLKNPIHAISLAAELILRQPLDAAANARHAERIRGSSRRMVKMIEDLFDLARVRLGGGIPLERSRSDLAGIVQAAVAECQASAPGRIIEVRCDGNTEGEWDPTRIAQVVNNLVGNALRHGTPQSPIALLVQGRESLVALSVHNGGAIAPDVRESIFDPFRRGDGHGRKEGLGLGLFIVQQLVAAHRGTVEVESSEEQGTTFRVQLPRA